MLQSIPVTCKECGRVNGSTASRCIWCGLPIMGADGGMELTRVEVEYLSGIERLSEPTPVKLVVSETGLEISEILPGSRRFQITPGELVSALIVDASTTEGRDEKRAWWWLIARPFALLVQGKKRPSVKNHDYVLTIKYRKNGKILDAAFHRKDRIGLALLEGVARVIEMIIKSSK